jgi:hypothetical protein
MLARSTIMVLVVYTYVYQLYPPRVYCTVLEYVPGSYTRVIDPHLDDGWPSFGRFKIVGLSLLCCACTYQYSSIAIQYCNNTIVTPTVLTVERNRASKLEQKRSTPATAANCSRQTDSKLHKKHTRTYSNLGVNIAIQMDSSAAPSLRTCAI